MWDVNDLIIILGGGIGVMLASTINRALAQAQLRRPAASHPHTRSRLTDKERSRARYRGTLLIALAVLIMPIGMISIAWLQQSNKTSSTAVIVGGILGGVGICLLLITGSMLVMVGRRMRAPDAERTLARDARPPIVYLRPFHFDRTSRQAVARTEFFTSTHEERLARVLRRIGPFIALGDPTEKLRELGAARLYSDEAHWKQAIERLTATAGTIVVHVGDSPGLAWELQHVVNLGQPERIILSLITEDRQRYSDFRNKLGHVFPCGLMEDIGSSDFLYFDADWTPRAYDGRRPVDSPPGSPGEQRTMALRQLSGHKSARTVPEHVFRAVGFFMFIVFIVWAITILPNIYGAVSLSHHP